MIGLVTILTGFLFPQDNSLDVQLKNYLNDKLKNYAKYEYQIVQAPNNYSRIEINYEKQAQLTKNYFYVPVKIYNSKNLYSGALLTVRVKFFQNVLVATTEIKRNENLSMSMFDIKMEDVSMYEGKTLDVESDLANFKSKVSVRAGTVLSKDMIVPVPLISKGDKIILHTGGSGVNVSIDVIARQEGSAGDVISVYANGSKLYKGKIIDKSNLTLVE